MLKQSLQMSLAFLLLAASAQLSSAQLELIRGEDRATNVEAAKLIGEGDAFQQADDHQKAQAAFDAAVRLRRALLERYPAVSEFQWGLAVAITRRAILNLEFDNNEAADGQLIEAVGLLRTALDASSPTDRLVRDYRQSFDIARSYRARILAQRGDEAGAFALYEAILESQLELLDAEPENARRPANLAITLYQMGELKMAEEAFELSHTLFSRANTYFELAVEMSAATGDAGMSTRAGAGYFMAGQISWKLGRGDRAWTEFERALEHFTVALAARPEDPLANDLQQRTNAWLGR
ncbi:hypothetical protein [Salinarimonas chemoclinalis]|uniref:hypothetical protein n=1 Tax=Salinarimonas chemoclinalis TaxID=3241599 RepID=UPI003558EEE7